VEKLKKDIFSPKEAIAFEMLCYLVLYYNDLVAIDVKARVRVHYFNFT
jgi:hypothetical protein